MRLPGLIAAYILVTSATGEGRARADVAPPHQVQVSHSIHVDVEGALPAGKSLVMTGTWGGADVLRVGETVPFKLGKYELIRLFLIDSGDLPELASVLATFRPQKSSYEARAAITDRGAPCSDYIEVQRRTAEASPMKEVRLFYSIKADGASCASRPLRTELLSSSGDVIEVHPGSMVWSRAQAGPVSSAMKPLAGPPEGQPAANPAGPKPGELPGPAPSCGSCYVGTSGDVEWPAAALMALYAIARRRRRMACSGTITSLRSSTV